jgi:hypothetical protein
MDESTGRNPPPVGVSLHAHRPEVDFGHFAQRPLRKLPPRPPIPIPHTVSSLVPRGAPCADQPHEVTVPLDEDNEQDACGERLADDGGVLRVAFVLDDQSRRIGEDRRGLLERDSVVPCVSGFPASSIASPVAASGRHNL